MNALFTKADTWTGGYYGLVIGCAEEAAFDAAAASMRMWQHERLDGCFLDPDREPSDQRRLSPNEGTSADRVYGIARLASSKQVACAQFRVQNSLMLGMPLGSLGTVFSIGAYPFRIAGEPTPEPWLREVNSFIEEIGRYVYQEVKFELGIIGFEVDIPDAQKQAAAGVAAERWNGLFVAENDQLLWFPPTIYLAPAAIEKWIK